MVKEENEIVSFEMMSLEAHLCVSGFCCESSSNLSNMQMSVMEYTVYSFHRMTHCFVTTVWTSMVVYRLCLGGECLLVLYCNG